MYEQFTDRARKVMMLANQEAESSGCKYIGTEHILLGLVRVGSGVATTVLTNLGVDLPGILREVEQLGPREREEVTEAELTPMPGAKKAIEFALDEARRLGHHYVGSEHILLGLLREEEGVAAQVLVNLGLSLENTRREVLGLLGQETDPAQPRTEAIPAPATDLPQGRKPQVAVADFLSDDLEPERAVLGDVADVVALGALTEQDLAGRIEGADAIILYHQASLSRETLQQLQRCKLIVRGGVGIDNIDYQFARQCGIPVANVPDYGSEEVADSAIGMALSLARGTHLMNSRLRAGQGAWSHEQAAPLTRLRGQTFGVVGLGRIGTATALRAKALGMKVVFYDPHKDDGYDKALGIRRAESLQELLADSLVVSIHCPLTDETREMIDAAAIAQMPRRSYLVNTARGGVVDTRAVPEAIASGRLAGAALDVLEIEPPPDNHPLMLAWRNPDHPAHHRLIVNPHAAFYSQEGILDIRRKTAEACRRAILGERLRNVVN
jgi:D-3-phosphoglycerate dehydrogenase/C-terminal binding protein